MNARGALGKYGENLAARRLTEAGMTILARNWRAGRAGEIDIVALDRDALVICEVKTRRVRRTPAAAEAAAAGRAGPPGPRGHGTEPPGRPGRGTEGGVTAADPSGTGHRGGPTGTAQDMYVFQHPMAALTPTQADRLRGLAECWMRQHTGPPSGGVRIDLIGVTLPARGAPVVEHVRGVA